MVDVEYVATFARLVPLGELRDVRGLTGMLLFTRPRLSVQPMTAAQLKIIVRLGARPAL
jgi:predicted RNA-binding protein with PUA-like domain